MPRLCSLDGCERKHVARGLCGTHYNQQHQPNRHRKVTLTCATCHEPVTKDAGRDKRYANIYCSLECRDINRKRAKQQIVPWKPRPVLHWAIERMPGKPKKRRDRTLTAGYCVVCVSPFVAAVGGTKTCSPECGEVNARALVREAKHRRRARQRNAFVAPVHRLHIYKRDNWVCQLCMEPLNMDATAPEPDAPTIDHILALANGGTHEPSNVQAAHFRCNAIKSDREWVRQDLAA